MTGESAEKETLRFITDLIRVMVIWPFDCFCFLKVGQRTEISLQLWPETVRDGGNLGS